MSATAVGPDVDEVGHEEAWRRLREILAESFYGEQAWRVQKCIRKITEERSTERS